MSDCRFGVSPVNYPDPDPGPFSLLCATLLTFGKPNAYNLSKFSIRVASLPILCNRFRSFLADSWLWAVSRRFYDWHSDRLLFPFCCQLAREKQNHTEVENCAQKTLTNLLRKFPSRNVWLKSTSFQKIMRVSGKFQFILIFMFIGSAWLSI